MTSEKLSIIIFILSLLALKLKNSFYEKKLMKTIMSNREIFLKGSQNESYEAGLQSMKSLKPKECGSGML